MEIGEGVEEVRLAAPAPETAYYLVEAGATRVGGPSPTHAGLKGLGAQGSWFPRHDTLVAPGHPLRKERPR